MDLKTIPTLIIGAGRVGTAMAFCLKQKGAPIVAITSRSRKKKETARKLRLPFSIDYLEHVSQARLILIAVSDDSIPDVARRIHRSGVLKPGTFAGHFSGALTSSVLKGGKKIIPFSLHPLGSFSSFAAGSKTFQDIPMIFEGAKSAETIGRAITNALGGVFLEIKETEKPLYHAAACFASNFFVTLVSVASRLNELAGIPREKSLSILFPLVRTTLRNIETSGIPDALTGPIERGDAETVKMHLHILKKKSKIFLQLYRILGLETLKLACEKGLPVKKVKTLKNILERA